MKYTHNGVPERSILGPLLFFVHINDLPISSNLFIFLMYADDSTLYNCCLEDIASEHKAHTLNIKLEGVHSWLNANQNSELRTQNSELRTQNSEVYST